jgi:hypothetical protein
MKPGGKIVRNFDASRKHWYTFQLKIPIWVNSGGSCNRKILVYFMVVWSIFVPLVYIFCGHLVYISCGHLVYIFCGHLVYIFCGHFVYCVIIWYILWSHGIICGHLVYLMSLWYILWHFGIFYDTLVYFMTLWYILWHFGICYGTLVYFTTNNLANLNRRRLVEINLTKFSAVSRECCASLLIKSSIIFWWFRSLPPSTLPSRGSRIDLEGCRRDNENGSGGSMLKKSRKWFWGSDHAEWPDWANFRAMGDCLPWAFFLISEVAHIFGYFFPQLRLGINFAKNVLGYFFGRYFSQTHLVTLVRCYKTSPPFYTEK